MHIRDAEIDDLPALLAIHNEAVRDLDALWMEREDTMDDRRAWFEARRAAGFPVIVAIGDEGRVLGYGSYGTYRSREGYRATVEHSVYLFADARGKGAGKALLEELITRARAAGLHAMVAVIDARNELSIVMHEKFGFESSGILRQVGQKRGRWLDQVQMVLLLDDRPHP